jgi:hypothetical protein
MFNVNWEPTRSLPNLLRKDAPEILKKSYSDQMRASKLPRSRVDMDQLDEKSSRTPTCVTMTPVFNPATELKTISFQVSNRPSADVSARTSLHVTLKASSAADDARQKDIPEAVGQDMST